MRSHITIIMMQKFLLFATCLTLGAAQLRGVRRVLYKSSEPLKLTCGIVSELGKDAKYEWQKDGKLLASANKGVLNNRDGSLQFQSPDESTEGIYQCLAKSDLGVASSEFINVKRIYINIPKTVKKTHSPVRGRPYELECPQVDAYPKAEIAWMRQEKNDQMKPYLTVRTTMAPNNHLYYSNVTEEDANKDVKYICTTVHVGSSETVILAEHVITDLKESSDTGLKKAVPQYLSKDTVANEGDSIFIYCLYGGDLAPPDYFFEGKNVNGDENPASQRITRHNRSKGRRLHIKDVLLSDQGHYSCKITEPDGSTTTHTMKLAVNSAPKYEKKPEDHTSAKLGQDVIIPCQVKGVPAPRVSWTYNAKPLTSNDRLSFATSGTSDVTNGDLKIKGVQRSDAGYYGCKASNENGEDIYYESLLTVA